MTYKNPYEVIKHRYVTEKAVMLEELKNAKSSRSLALCESPKYVFVVDKKATKPQIASALEEIYGNIKVVSVNTIQVKQKPTRKTRGKQGYKNAFKKAIVTLEPKDTLDNT